MMKRKLFFVSLICLLVTSLILAGCAGETTPTSQTQTTSPTASTPTPSSEVNWWDGLGTPQYGGSIVQRADDLGSLTPDIAKPAGGLAKYGYYYSYLFGPIWTLDRDIWAYSGTWIPVEYCEGQIAEKWEQISPTTITVTIREGVYWQNKEPVNGREFTAEDVQYNYDMLLGTGSGFDKPSPIWSVRLGSIDKVVATGKYTVDFYFKNPSVWNIDLIMNTQVPMVAREWVEQGDLDNVEGAVGTSSWMVQEFVQNTSLTLIRNPDYWGYDARYPENQIPYADELRVVAVPDLSTVLASLRTGKIDMQIDLMTGPSLAQTDSLLNTNQEIQVSYVPSLGGYNFTMRCDQEPFDDIRVRKALQLAVNIPDIAASVYMGRVDPEPLTLVHPSLTGWTTPYDEWPDELKNEYGYNPEKARELLSEAGYPNGFETEVSIQATFGTELTEILKSYFSDVNVDLEISAMDTPTLKHLMESGTFTGMMAQPDIGRVSPKDAVYLRFQTSSDGELTNLNRNSTYNNDSYYNDMYNDFMKATSMDEAAVIANEMCMYALAQHWAVNLCGNVAPYIWQPWIGGYVGEAGITGEFLYSRIWVDKDLKESMGY